MKKKWIFVLIVLLIICIIAIIFFSMYIITSNIIIDDSHEPTWYNFISNSLSTLIGVIAGGFLTYLIVRHQLSKESKNRRQLDKEQFDYETKMKAVSTIASEYSKIKVKLINTILQIHHDYQNLFNDSKKNSKEVFDFNAKNYYDSLENVAFDLNSFTVSNSVILKWMKNNTNLDFNNLERKLFSLGANWALFLEENEFLGNQLKREKFQKLIDKYNYFLEKLNNIMKNAIILESLIYKHYYQDVFGDIAEQKLNPLIKIDENNTKIILDRINTIMEKIND